MIDTQQCVRTHSSLEGNFVKRVWKIHQFVLKFIFCFFFFFVKSIYSIIYLWKILFLKVIVHWFHKSFSRNGRTITCGKMMIYFSPKKKNKKIVKPTLLLLRNFCQKCMRENFRNFHSTHSSLEITEIYCHTFLPKLSWK